jgi:hypothetical protein
MALMAAAFVGLFLFTLVLAALPQLHERVHQTGSPDHKCAVTLLASGQYQHTPTAAISMVPPAPPVVFTHPPDSFFLAAARLEFSLLEHAPPAAS